MTTGNSELDSIFGTLPISKTCKASEQRLQRVIELLEAAMADILQAKELLGMLSFGENVNRKDG